MPSPTSDYDFATPMMQQYLQLKEAHPDCILFFRLGDFYEMFLDDAQQGADILDITLTSRSRGKDGKIPMAGVPYHAAHNYIHKLIKAGHKVAICEQVSEPDGKGLVDRQVVRIITPGTVLDDLSLETKANNFLLLLHWDGDTLATSAVDISTGELLEQHWSVVEATLPALLERIIFRLRPAEVLVTKKLLNHSPSLKKLKQTEAVIYPLARKLAAQQTTPALLEYIQQTQMHQPEHLSAAQPILPQDFMELDPATVANLELLQTVSYRTNKGTLLEILDQTHTAMGGRLLKNWLLQPLSHLAAIEERLAVVAYLLEHTTQRDAITALLSQVADIERLLSRLSFGSGTPRDLKQLLQTVEVSFQLLPLIKNIQSPLAQTFVRAFSSSLEKEVSTVSTSLVDEPPVDPKQGGVITRGINNQLDKLHSQMTHSRTQLAALEKQEREATGITNLKVGFNKVFGYYLEVSQSHVNKVPERYLRKQTLVNAERYITPELKEYETTILEAEDKCFQLEYELFQDLVRKTLAQTTQIQALAKAVAQLDCLVSFAQISQTQRYCRPQLTTDGQLDIIQGRHPVVEQIVSGEFVPNDVKLNQTNQQLILLTGPNMAGKSVLMRQVALIVLMAHLGCYVPATKADIPVTDRIFVRSGAHDAIAEGKSTFMVEMSETAAILDQATPDSLIIMDEIGRGTSTYDGISLASAIAEHLVTDKKGPKTLFATHYHELQTLAERFPEKVTNMHLAVQQHDQDLVFLYTLQPGGASHSFGLAVAKLAQLPAPVIERAQAILNELEQEETASASKAKTAPAATPTSQKYSFIEHELRQLQLDQLTPLAALNTLATWKDRLS